MLFQKAGFPAATKPKLIGKRHAVTSNARKCPTIVEMIDVQPDKIDLKNIHIA
jgi:hypothetical protein